MRTYTFKLYRSKRNKHLHRKINIAGMIYNHLIALHRRHYRLFGKGISANRVKLHITRLKKTKRFAFWNKLGSQAIQDIAERIDRAYKLFFRNLKRKVKTAPPGFKKVKKYKSFTLKQAGYSLLEGNQIAIMGKRYKFSKSRDIQGNIKTFTVRRDNLGDFWLHFVTDEDIQPLQVRSGKSVGLDFGLKTFLTGSDETRMDSPLHLHQASKEIRKLSKNLSSKQKGSGNRERARLDLARKHRRIVNLRKEFHCKTALGLARAYDFVAVEDLNIKAMQRLWGRKISDLGHGSFLGVLDWMLRKHGGQMAKIDRFYPSSKQCSVPTCLHRLPELPLKVRSWVCPNCGAHHDRDLNAARNIHRVGASTREGKAVRPDLSGGLC